MLYDVCGGLGDVGRAFRARGGSAHAFDLRIDPKLDITKPRVLNGILHDITRAKVSAVMLAPPCNRWSISNRRARRLRSRAHPWGLPNLSRDDREFLRGGNATARATLRILRQCMKHNVPCMVEQPVASAMRWVLEPVLARCSRSDHVVFDQCAFGARWRKRTWVGTANI